jgi:hypothetical protein
MKKYQKIRKKCCAHPLDASIELVKKDYGTRRR